MEECGCVRGVCAIAHPLKYDVILDCQVIFPLCLHLLFEFSGLVIVHLCVHQVGSGTCVGGCDCAYRHGCENGFGVSSTSEKPTKLLNS